MKNIIRVSLIVLIVWMFATPVFATSNITNALWHGVARVTNTGTAATDISVNMTLSSANMVSNGYMRSDFTDVAFLVNGTDTAFQPSINASYPWMFWVPSIGNGQNLDADMYSGNVTGGKLRFFGTLSVPDHASLEWSANGSVTWSGMLATGNLTRKSGALLLTYDQTTSNVTVSVTDSSNNVPSGAAGWPVGSANAIDGNTATFATSNNPGAAAWSDYLTITIPSVWTNRFRVYPNAGGGYTTLESSAYYDSGWHVVSSATPTDGAWNEITMDSYQQVTELRFRRYTTTGGNSQIAEVQYGIAQTVTKTGITATDRVITVDSNATNLRLQVDGGAWSTTSPVTMLDNSSAWLFNEGMPYMAYSSVSVGGNQKGYWSWQYATTFTDQSGNGNTGTPTFRTTSSNPNVTAQLISLEPTSLAQASVTDLTSVNDILPNTAITIGQLYTEGNFVHVPGGQAINEILGDSEIPWELWWFPVVYIGTAVIGFTLYWWTTLSVRGGVVSTETQQDGSLLVMVIVIEVLIAVAGIVNIVPFWPALLFPVPALAVIVSKKHLAW